MQNAYRGLEDYQADLVITGFGNDSEFSGIQKLTYTFKKPNLIRVDFDSPHKGMSIAYPDKKGKVVVRLGRPLPLPFTLHLDPRSPLMEIAPGEYIDQTDLGLLITNISHTITDMFLGDLEVSEGPGTVIIRTLSDNPFKRGTPTRYAFTIDENYWLPVTVEESTAGGVLKRRVAYKNLRTNIGIRNSFFRIE
jgi:outer membrane lipoprotein-sorting protein